MTNEEKEKIKSNGYTLLEFTNWSTARNESCSERYRNHIRRMLVDGFVLESPNKSIHGPSVVMYVSPSN